MIIFVGLPVWLASVFTAINYAGAIFLIIGLVCLVGWLVVTVIAKAGLIVPERFRAKAYEALTTIAGILIPAACLGVAVIIHGS